jgi:microsomal dipeptidase-like Zn-dependent dipeptidase
MIPVKYILASKAFVYQMQHRADTLERLKSMGFIMFQLTYPTRTGGGTYEPDIRGLVRKGRSEVACAFCLVPDY